MAILCLGFGIGLNATIFSVIDGVLLKPYPYTDPDRILVVGEQNQRTDSQAGLSYLDMRDWKEANSVFTTIAARRGTEPDDLGSRRRAGALPRRGRVVGSVSAARDVADSRPRLQRRGRSARRAAASCCSVTICGPGGIAATRTSSGKPILVNGKPHVVIGVMPAGFAFPNNQRLWIPLEPDRLPGPAQRARPVRLRPDEAGRDDRAGAPGARRHRRPPGRPIPGDERRLDLAPPHAPRRVSARRRCRSFCI